MDDEHAKGSRIANSTGKTDKRFQNNRSEEQKQKAISKLREKAERTRTQVRDAYIFCCKEYRRSPTLREIAKKSKLALTTVHKYVSDIKPTDFSEYRFLTSDVVGAVYASAMAGNTQSQKLWMEVVEGHGQKLDDKVSGDGLVIWEEDETLLDPNLKLDQGFDDAEIVDS